MGGVSERRDVVILGSTGSIGTQALEVVRANPDRFRVVALTAHSNAVDLAKLAREFAAEVAVVADEAQLPALREALSGSGIEAAGGPAALVEAVAPSTVRERRVTTATR